MATIRKPRPVFRWSFLAAQAVFALWAVSSAARSIEDACVGLDAQSTCRNADSGAAIGFGAVVGLWIAVDAAALLGRLIVLRVRRRQ